ncbi:MAG: hypothetical protein WC405_21520 [Syntrophales bacterium]
MGGKVIESAQIGIRANPRNLSLRRFQGIEFSKESTEIESAQLVESAQLLAHIEIIEEKSAQISLLKEREKLRTFELRAFFLLSWEPEILHTDLGGVLSVPLLRGMSEPAAWGKSQVSCFCAHPKKSFSLQGPYRCQRRITL